MYRYADVCSYVPSYGNSSRCTQSYSFDAEDKAAYAPGWIQSYSTTLNQISLTNQTNNSLTSYQTYLTDLDKAFIYSSAAEQENDAYWGEYATYSGGGYTANLGDSLNSSQATLADLENSGWIDMYTRAVFVEFNVFNPGSGLANLVRVLLELPNTGDNIWSSRMETVQLYRYSGQQTTMTVFIAAC